MDRTQKKNTVGFDFGRSGVMPTLKEAISFLVRDLGIKDSEVHSVYLDVSDKTFFVKFIDETTLKETTQRLSQTEDFKYADGRVVQVQVVAADGFFRYVRLFNLPPEVTDADIAKALSKFGTVRQLVREKLPADLGFDAFSGTRGAHMEVKMEIPPALYIGHYKCRIFYEGLRNRCFTCKQEGHVKADCPNKASAQRSSAAEIPSGGGQGLMDYAGAAKGVVLPAPIPPVPGPSKVVLPLKPNGGQTVILEINPDDRLKVGGDSDQVAEVEEWLIDGSKDGGESDGIVKPIDDSTKADGGSSETGLMEISPTRVTDTGSRNVSPAGPQVKPKTPRGRSMQRNTRGGGKRSPRLTIPGLLKALETRSRSRSIGSKNLTPKSNKKNEPQA